MSSSKVNLEDAIDNIKRIDLIAEALHAKVLGDTQLIHDTLLRLHSDVTAAIQENTSPTPIITNRYKPDLHTVGNLRSAMAGSGFVYAQENGDVSVGGGTLQHWFRPTDTGSYHQQAAHKLPDNRRVYYVEQTVTFADDFNAVIGGKFGFGFTFGKPATGGQIEPAGCSARHMWRPSSIKGRVRLVLYTYQWDREFNNGRPWGDDNFIIDVKTGEPVRLETEIVLNSRSGIADGSMEVRVEGVPHLYKRAVCWQRDGTVGDNARAEYAGFYGGNGPRWAPDKLESMTIDGVRYTWQ